MAIAPVSVRRVAESDGSVLVRRARLGDDSAFVALVNLHASRIHAIASALLGPDSDEAEDATQETFVRAYERLRQCRDPERFGAWLVRIARNTCKDRRKSGWSRRVTIGSPDTAVATSPCPSSRGADLDLQRALERLPEGQRLAIVLRFFYGYSLADIGEAIGADAEGARSRVRRALARLRKSLGPEWEEDLR